MYACNNCGDDVDEQNMMSTNEGEILCAPCFSELMEEEE